VNTIKIHLGNNAKVCRSEFEYFINGNSTQPYEFGTIEFPFKRLIWASRELSNLREDNYTPIKIYFF
jgi:hypothetical protein